MIGKLLTLWTFLVIDANIVYGYISINSFPSCRLYYDLLTSRHLLEYLSWPPSKHRLGCHSFARVPFPDRRNSMDKIVCPFDYTDFAVSLEGSDPVNQFNHTSFNDNCCAIEVVWWRLCVVSWLSFFEGIGAFKFVIGLSQISSFFFS